MSLTNSLSKARTSSGKVNQKAFSNGKGGKGKLGGIIGSVGGTTKNVAGTVKGVGNIVASAAGALGFTGLQEALTGKTTINYNKPWGEQSGLRGFYSYFSGANYVDRIDPLVTFTCQFTFFPNEFDVDIEKISHNTKYDVVTDAGESDNNVVNRFLKIYYKSFFDNIEWNEIESNEIGNDNETVISDTEDGDSITRIDYDSFQAISTRGKDIVVPLDIFIQKVTIPQLQIEGSEEITTLVGKFPVPGNIVVPDSNTFQIEVINTKAPIIENIFYPWMRETTLPKWVYDKQPFTTANISFNFTEHANIIYHFFGCRPTSIQLLHPDQAPMTNLTRQIQFTFDFMTIETTDKTKDGEFIGMHRDMSGAKKDGRSEEGLLNSILFSAANTLKL